MAASTALHLLRSLLSTNLSMLEGPATNNYGGGSGGEGGGGMEGPVNYNDGWGGEGGPPSPPPPAPVPVDAPCLRCVLDIFRSPIVLGLLVLPPCLGYLWCRQRQKHEKLLRETGGEKNTWAPFKHVPRGSHLLFLPRAPSAHSHIAGVSSKVWNILHVVPARRGRGAARRGDASWRGRGRCASFSLATEKNNRTKCRLAKMPDSLAVLPSAPST